MTLVYVAQPVDFNRVPGDLNAAFQELTIRLYNQHGLSLFRPATAFSLVKERKADDSVYRANMAVLGECDAMLALVAGPSIGVPAEVQHMIGTGKPVVVVCEAAALASSYQLAGWAEQQNVAVLGWGHDVLSPTQVAGWLKLPPYSFEAEDGTLKNFALWAGPEVTVTRTQIDEKRMPSLRFQVEPHGQMPTKAYPDDAGWDLYVDLQDDWEADTLGIYVQPNEFRDIPLGVRVQFPTGWWGRLTGRSSTMRKYGLHTVEGIIDHGYRGPLYVGVRNLGKRKVLIEHGMRIAQLIPQQTFPGGAVKVDQLDPHKRGHNGFGSSGR